MIFFSEFTREACLSDSEAKTLRWVLEKLRSNGATEAGSDKSNIKLGQVLDVILRCAEEESQSARIFGSKRGEYHAIALDAAGKLILANITHLDQIRPILEEHKKALGYRR